jgi:(1->4)-alpha-D-glucan 1-alpha-D-glucosylmutase
MNEDDLRRQAEAMGIAAGFHDIAGTWHDVKPEVLAHLIATLGEGPPEPTPAPTGGGYAFLPGPIAAGERVWGVAIQLYGLRSRRNWGIGDFGDLRTFASIAAATGASAVQLNPMHALFPCYRNHISPYAPSSRFFLNPLYVDVEAVPDLAECAPAQEMVASTPFQRTLARLRAAPLVDYDGVAACKIPILRLLFENFHHNHLAESSSARARDFQAFREDAGELLARFSVFEALCEYFHATHPGGWQTWPVCFRNPDSPEVAQFAADHEGAVLHSTYLQWIAWQQLRRVADVARHGNMAIGIIADIAIGCDGASADAWTDQELVVQDVELGAPPDPFCEDGQTWGVRPWRPNVLYARGCSPMGELLGRTMQWAGGIRLDHAAGLARQFWVPHGLSGRDGAYVAYPREELIGQIAAASQEHRCLVIGEDLGTVPAGLSDRLRQSNILTTCVLYFERSPDGRFRPPSHYPRLSCACVATHDLATLAGFIEGRDIRLRASIAHDSVAETETALIARHETTAALRNALTRNALLAPSATLDTNGFTAVVHGFIASTTSALAIAQLEDVLGVADQANVPGTLTQHPNWRRKYPVAVDTPEMRENLAATADVFRRHGRL